MYVSDAVLKRKSIRSYQDKPVSDDDLAAILKAGRYASVSFPPISILFKRGEGFRPPPYGVVSRSGDLMSHLEPRSGERRCDFDARQRVGGEADVVTLERGDPVVIRLAGGRQVLLISLQISSDRREGRLGGTVIEREEGGRPPPRLLLRLTDRCRSTPPYAKSLERRHSH